jgi:hypothetical protein
MVGHRSSRRAVVIAGAVLLVAVAGFGAILVRAMSAPLGQCRMGGGGDVQGTLATLNEAGEFHSVSTWSADGGPADPPRDRTVRASASIGKWRGGEPVEQPSAAHVATSDDVERALRRDYRVVSTMKDVEGSGSFGSYRNYLLVAIGIAPDGTVAFLGECGEASSRWFADVSRDLGMAPEAVLVDFLDHRGSSALDTRVLSVGG